MDITGDQIVKLLPALGIGATLPAVFTWLKERTSSARKAETDTVVAREAEETKRDIAEDSFELQLIGNLQAWAEKLLNENDGLRTKLLSAEEKRLHAEARTVQMTMENNSLREQAQLAPSLRNRDLLLGSNSTTTAASTPPASASGPALGAGLPSSAATLSTFTAATTKIGEEPAHHHD